MKLSNLGIFLLRVGISSMMIFGHGWEKIITFQVKAASFPDPFNISPTYSLALSTFAEFFCAIAVLLGLLTRFATIPLIINMAVAVFVIHGLDPFKVKEKAVLYLLTYVFIAIVGPGRFSLDELLKKKKTLF